jgi:acyl-CoA thioesterase FadM
MNLYLRLLWLLWRMRSVARCDLFAPSRVPFRVLPNDCDINLHLNNGRYLSFMDLGRLHLTVQAGLMPHARRNRWMPVLAAAEITFIRSLNPFDRFELVTRIITWDEKYVYLEQTFERDGELCAHAYVKGLFLGRGGRVSNTEIVRAIGYDGAPPAMTGALQRWAEMTAAKRDGENNK